MKSGIAYLLCWAAGGIALPVDTTFGRGNIDSAGNFCALMADATRGIPQGVVLGPVRGACPRVGGS
jgi:hypothetical protein